MQYVAVLNWFVPKSLIHGLAVLETIIELGLGIALLLGIYQRVVAWSSAVLLMSFALTMSIALGIAAPLSYSVFTAFGAALLLGAGAVRPALQNRQMTSVRNLQHSGPNGLHLPRRPLHGTPRGLRQAQVSTP